MTTQKKHTVRVIDRHARGATDDVVFIECDGKVFKGIYDARYFDDQIEQIFRRDFLGEDITNER